MGNYISSSDARTRLDRVYRALYADQAGDYQSAWLDADIAAVEGEVDSYLAHRYVVPVTGGSVGLLRGLCEDLLAERAHQRRPSGSVPEGVAAAAKRARETLAKVAAGTLSLGAATVPAERAGQVDVLVVEGNTPEMTRTKLQGF